MILIHPYSAVAGLTSSTEVLVCGHEWPRYDQTEGFQHLAEVSGHPLYPRSRRCHTCLKPLTETAQRKMTGPPQLVADWGELSAAQREHPLVRAMATPLELPDPADWKAYSPKERQLLALLVERAVTPFGLTFREFVTLNKRPPETLTARGYKRLTASPSEKERRREAEQECWRQSASERK